MKYICTNVHLSRLRTVYLLGLSQPMHTDDDLRGAFFFEALVIGLFAMERMHSKGLIDANFDSHPALKIWSGGSMFYIDAAQVPDRRGLILI